MIYGNLAYKYDYIEEKLIKKASKKLIKQLDSLGLKDFNINCKINEVLKKKK